MKRYLIWILLSFAIARAEEPLVEHLTYDDFVRAVENGKIKHVHFYNMSGIEGTIVSPQGEVRFDTARGLPTSNDPLLLRLLKSNGVTFDQSDEPKFQNRGFGYNSWQLMQLGFLLTIALVVIAILQLKILRRLERKSNQSAQPPQAPGLRG